MLERQLAGQLRCHHVHPAWARGSYLPACYRYPAGCSPVHLAMQKRYAAGVREMLECWMQHKPFPEQYYIVREGQLASQYL